MSVKATASTRKRGKAKRIPSAASAPESNLAPEPNVASPPTPAAELVCAPDAPVSTVVQLDGGLQIKDVEDAHRRLMAAFDRGSSVAIDISRVGIVDTAGVQLLLSLSSEAARRGVAIEMHGESPAFTKALAALGLGGPGRTTVP